MPSVEEIIAAIEAWFTDRIQVGPIAHQVSCYNQAFKAHLDLKDRLITLITGKPVEAAAPEPEAAETAVEEPAPEAEATEAAAADEHLDEAPASEA